MKISEDQILLIILSGKQKIARILAKGLILVTSNINGIKLTAYGKKRMLESVDDYMANYFQKLIDDCKNK